MIKAEQAAIAGMNEELEREQRALRDLQDRQAAAQAFAEAQGVTFPILMDRTGEVGRLYLVRALPTTFFVDRQGIIRKLVVGGPMSEATLASTVRDLLDEAP